MKWYTAAVVEKPEWKTKRFKCRQMQGKAD